MRLGRLVVADPVESVARHIADGCDRLADERIVATSGERTLVAAATARPEMVILSLELARPETLLVATELRRACPDAFIIITFRELAVPTMERLGKLGIDDFMSHPVDLTAVYRAASRRFGVGFRRHERHEVALDVLRADGVLIGRTINLSEGGMRLSAFHPLAAGDSLLVALMMPDDKPLQVRCHVLAVEGRPPVPVIVRAQFDNLRGREHERLARYLATLEPAPAGS